MRKLFSILFLVTPAMAFAQDSLKTTTLNEVVVTGTKFDIPVEKSGKTIFKLSESDLRKYSGRSVADVLNEIPGIQIDGNFGAPGSNISYYVRGGRNRHTLVLIDGVPFNDPSAINAEYDLRYLSLSQIESIEVLKGGLSTLYGTNAAAAVINITLKKSSNAKVSGEAELQAGSFKTFSQALTLKGQAAKIQYFVNGSNTSSKGFSSAFDNDPSKTFDRDGFAKQNFLAKASLEASKGFKIGIDGAFEKFNADFDAYEFTDADNSQAYEQLRFGVTPSLSYDKGITTAKLFYNKNTREFSGDFPSLFKGRNFQGELIHRHSFSSVVSISGGIQIQNVAYDEEDVVSSDSAHISMVDPYISAFIDHPSGFVLHGGIRINTHSIYGANPVYNINPAFLVNKNGKVNYKLYVSWSSSYIVPSLYQLFSFYGNKELTPEEAVNAEAGLGITGPVWKLNVAYYSRNETSPVDFVSIFDNDGNYIGGQYQNVVRERNVSGIEFDFSYRFSESFSVSGNYSHVETDRPSSFQRIPADKFGLNFSVSPVSLLDLTLRYNYTGSRTTFGFIEEVTLQPYQLVDVFVSMDLLKQKFNVYASANNVFDEDYTGVYGYTTRGRNFSLGLRYKF